MFLPVIIYLLLVNFPRWFLVNILNLVFVFSEVHILLLIVGGSGWLGHWSFCLLFCNLIVTILF
jgi:hypothetical protein